MTKTLTTTSLSSILDNPFTVDGIDFTAPLLHEVTYRDTLGRQRSQTFPDTNQGAEDMDDFVDSIFIGGATEVSLSFVQADA